MGVSQTEKEPSLLLGQLLFHLRSSFLFVLSPPPLLNTRGGTRVLRGAMTQTTTQTVIGVILEYILKKYEHLIDGTLRKW
jgi:hypothetical protein